MANTRPLGLVGALLLLLVLLLAGAARAGYLAYYANNAHSPGPLLVQDAPAPLRDIPPEAGGGKAPNELQSLVQNLKDKTWYGTLAPFAKEEEQTAHYSPGYPWLVGLLAKQVPAEKLDSTVRWIQCGLGP